MEKLDRVKILGPNIENRRSYFDNLGKHVLSKAQAPGHDGQLWVSSEFETPLAKIAFLGGNMEITEQELKAVNNEIAKSIEVLKEGFNDVVRTRELLEPQLLGMVQKIRDVRMNVSIELSKSLSTMRDVRKFFIEAEYKEEMERLERFVSLGERMKALIADGTMDAICDVSLKLAVGKEGPS